jgi:hypothetical protein
MAAKSKSSDHTAQGLMAVSNGSNSSGGRYGSKQQQQQGLNSLTAVEVEGIIGSLTA